MSDVPEDDARTVLAFYSLNAAKQTKVVNDGLVSVLNNEVALELKSEEEQELAREAYQKTADAYLALNDLSESLDETSDDEQSVASRFNPASSEDVGGEGEQQ